MSVVDEIKQRLDIVDLIGDYVPLQKAGHNFKGLCPFHTEKTPSFVVFPDTQSWHCFGACSTGGDAFTFVMRRENMDFAEALGLLADKTSVELTPFDQLEIGQKEELDRLRDVNASAAQFFHHTLLESASGELPGPTFATEAWSERRWPRSSWAMLPTSGTPSRTICEVSAFLERTSWL